MISPGQHFTLPSGQVCILSAPKLPLVRNYYALAIDGGSQSNTDELWTVAHRVARQLATQTFRDPECFSLVFNAARTRRRTWAHVHILLARSPREKRWTMFCLFLKRFLRWRQWPVLRLIRAHSG